MSANGSMTRTTMISNVPRAATVLRPPDETNSREFTGAKTIAMIALHRMVP